MFSSNKRLNMVIPQSSLNSVTSHSKQLLWRTINQDGIYFFWLLTKKLFMFLSHIKCWSFCQAKWYEELYPSSKAWSLLWLLTNYIWIAFFLLTYSSHQNAMRYLFFVEEISLLLQLHEKTKNYFTETASLLKIYFFIFVLLFFPLPDLLKGLQPGAQHAATLSHSPLPAHLQQAYTGKDIYFLLLILNLF